MPTHIVLLLSVNNFEENRYNTYMQICKESNCMRKSYLNGFDIEINFLFMMSFQWSNAPVFLFFLNQHFMESVLKNTKAVQKGFLKFLISEIAFMNL